MINSKQSGGAILEYLLVTSFTLITGIATLNYVGNIIKEKIETISEKLNIDAEQPDIVSWGDE